MTQERLPLDRPPKCEDDKHDYHETGGDMELERYVCRKCGDRYTLYYEDMK